MALARIGEFYRVTCVWNPERYVVSQEYRRGSSSVYRYHICRSGLEFQKVEVE